MPYVSFIPAPGCLAAAAGLVTPLRTCPVDRVAPFLCLRHGQAPDARPPSPKLPQPRVDLVHVAPPDRPRQARRLRRRGCGAAPCLASASLRPHLRDSDAGANARPHASNHSRAAPGQRPAPAIANASQLKLPPVRSRCSNADARPQGA